MKLTFGLNCPSCGGRVEISEGDEFAICPFCHTVSRVIGEDDVKVLAYKMKIDEKSARDSARRWFKKGLKARDLHKVAKITEIYHVYLPFWNYSAIGLGIICGYNIESDSNGRSRKVYKEQQIRKDYTWTNIACDAGDIGIKHLRNLKGEVIPLTEDLPKYEATTSKDDAKVEGDKVIRKWILSEGRISNITFHKEFVLPKSFSLLYYPFWIIRYDYKGKMYFLTVDGVTGKVVSGRAPGDPLWQSIVIGTGATIGGALLGLAPIVSGFAGQRAAILSMLVGVVIFGASYYFFRYGSEIVEGDIPKPYIFGGKVKIQRGYLIGKEVLK